MTGIRVTGVGVISAAGLNVRENAEALRSGSSGIAGIKYLRTSLSVPAGEVKASDEELARMLGIPPGKAVSRTALLGAVAAREAVEDAGIVPDGRTGLISATSAGGMDLSEDFYEEFRKDRSKGRLRNVKMHDCGAAAEFIADFLGVEGFVTTVSTACSSAGNAIMLGARMIRAGLLDTVIAGGADALCRFTLNGFNSLMILSDSPCRPFDACRKGLNLGEGAGYLVLQSDSACSGNPYCDLSGYANVNEAFHQTGSSPDGAGAFSAMTEAMKSAGLRPWDIDYVNMHGTGTVQNDLSESMALRRIFGGRVPMFSSVKAFIGHTLGASEGIEAVYSVLSVSGGTVYPNLNFSEPMPETGLAPVSRWEDGLDIRNVISNSFGFGGNNSSLVFSRSC